MTIETAAEALLGVVQMEGLDLRESDQPVERVQGLGVARLRREVVPGGKQMTGVEADDQSLRRLAVVQHPRQVLEPVAQARSLAGGGLEERRHLEPDGALQD